MTRRAEYETGLPQDNGVGAPDLEYDPVGNLNSRLARMEQRDTLSQIHGLINAAETSFAAEHPDYHDALQHVREKEVARRTKSGQSKEAAMQELYAAELQGAAQCLSQGRNPAELFYQAAQSSYGYTPRDAAQREQDAMDRELAADTARFESILGEAQGSLRGGE